MSDVRVYLDSGVPARMGGRALAYGKDIYLGPGAEDALAHEAWHVVQQKQGRVPQTAFVNGTGLNDDPSLEREADVMGEAAERVSASRVLEDCPRATWARRKIMRPVVQRTITVGDNTPSTAQARHQLNLLYRMTNANTLYLQQVVDEISNSNLNFANWNNFKVEVKRRSFGRRHVAAMEALKQVQDNERNNYIATHGYNGPTLEKFIGSYLGTTGRTQERWVGKYGAPSFITWTLASSPLKGQAMPIIRDAPFYKWYTNAANAANPLRMNCWECVLYSGAWTNNGARVPLYGTDYALWALRDRLLPNYQPSGVGGTHDAPFFIETIFNNSVYGFNSADDPSNKGPKDKRPVLPRTILPGMIISFNGGSHVALATGRVRANLTDEAQAVYGNLGHEILELDGKTLWIVRSTVEDCIAAGYNNYIRMGWLPEIVLAEQIRLAKTSGALLYQVTAQQTAFYT